MLDETNQNNTCIHRKSLLGKAKRIVVKVGSAVLAQENGMNLRVIENLAQQISLLHDAGKEIVLVSSGAVAAGKQKISYQEKKELSLQDKQALAAIGQSHLMHIYDEVFERHGQTIAQVLLTHADLAHRERYVNFKNTIFTLFKMGIVPIINENDTVSTEELQFGDNDNLGALVTNLIEGDIFICLTDVSCLYTSNPVENTDARPVHTVNKVTEDIEKMAGHAKSALGTGGMISKIRAAKKVADGGGSSFIGPGKEKDILSRLFDDEMLGTFFLPQSKRMRGKKQWIAHVLKPKGSIVIDEGACKAIITGGKSILPSGIIEVTGGFYTGDAITCVNSEGKILGVGLTNYRADDVNRIKGLRSEMIESTLGYNDSNVIIHRDNLVVL